MKKATHYLSAIVIVACFTQPASAQFEGKITFNSYEYAVDATEEKQDKFTLYITPDRILLKGDKKYNFAEAIQTEGVLVRLDFQDFVFLTGDKNVLKISKSDITNMMNFMSNGQSSDVAGKSENINYEQTNETATIQGYRCEKFIFRDEDEANAYTEVWMTQDLKMDWGMLAEPWGGEIGDIVDSFPTDLIFKNKYFPLKVETFEGDQLVASLQATEVNESPVARAMVQVPAGVQVLGFWDYMSQKTMNSKQ